MDGVVVVGFTYYSISAPWPLIELVERAGLGNESVKSIILPSCLLVLMLVPGSPNLC